MGVIGFGWLGRAHSRSLARIPMLFAGRGYDPVLEICADPAPGAADEAVGARRPRQGLRHGDGDGQRGEDEQREDDGQARHATHHDGRDPWFHRLARRILMELSRSVRSA